MATRNPKAKRARADTSTAATKRRKARRSGSSDGDRTELLEKIKADFDARLAAMAAEPARWIEFIDHVATFGARYSLSNQILLLVQAEERGIAPRYFLPYGKKDGSTGWKAQKRYVRKEETGFKVWAPVRRRPTEEQAAEWEAAGRKVKRETSGRPAVQVVGFTLVSTFELSQTEGAPFEPPTVMVRRRVQQRGTARQLLVGEDPTGVFDDLVTLITDEGYGYELVPPRTGHLGGANGVTVRRPGLQLVQVRADVEPAQRIKTTLHELAHIRCGHLDDAPTGENIHRGRGETEAESVAHIVLRALGLDTAGYSDAYVFGWANGDMDLVKECAETVLRAAKQILTDLTPADATDTGSDPTQARPNEPDPGGCEPPATRQGSVPAALPDATAPAIRP